MEDLILEIREHVAIVKFNRPKAMNAIGMVMARELHEALDLIEKDNNIRVLVITGEGDKSFCAGADLKERNQMTPEEMWVHSTLIKDAFFKLEKLRVPTIAAIQGFSLGGGTELALCCDLRVMEEEAELGLTEVRLGVFPGAGGAIRLPRQISIGDAKDILLTGRRVTGKEAGEMRLIQRIVKGKNRVFEEAFELAKQISMNGPLGVQAVKKVVNYGVESSLDVAFAYSDALRKPLDATRDYANALQAFSEKRMPTFEGK